MSHDRVVTVGRARVRGSRTILLGVVLVLAMAQGACGGGEPEPKTPQPAGGGPAAGATVSLPKETTAGGSAGPPGGAEPSRGPKDLYDRGVHALALGRLQVTVG